MQGRPADLPDYANPPLDEVVLGVQFDSISGYGSVMARDVWELYSDELPNIQGLQALTPQFELFGRSGSHSGPNIRLESAPIRGRLWFISEEETHLIQFQDDRFLLNWRRRENGAAYPRFEGTSGAFVEYFKRLDELFANRLGRRISINQAEITYMNLIKIDEFTNAGSWLSILDLSQIETERFVFNVSEIVRAPDGRPVARLHHELTSARAQDGKQNLLRLGLTCRGKPDTSDIEGALAFLTMGRERIVTRFGEIATESSDQVWGRMG